LKIKIISVGNKPPPWINELIKSYFSKIEHSFKISWVDIKPEKKFSSIQKKKELEAEKILSRINDEYVICLDEKGENVSSINFAKKLTFWSENQNEIIFIIGGADGLDNNILRRSNFKLSISAMTLPHNLVTIILIEQIFRGTSIIHNHPYHRE
jgi:23S rRNA (pseudouridine1915-N3)-methyltransferase